MDQEFGRKRIERRLSWVTPIWLVTKLSWDLCVRKVSLLISLFLCVDQFGEAQ